jgi:3-keto-5-aminohexanoate cleavage enzyme
MNKLIITAAITGGMQGKAECPGLPEQPEEQIQQTIDCWNAGASVIHIHARDKSGRASQDVEIYKRIKEGIRAKGCDIVIQFTTGGSPGMTIAERLQSIEADPDMASLNMGNTHFKLPSGQWIWYDVTADDMIWYAEKMKERKLKVEMEVYAPHMLRQVNMLIEKGLIEKPYYINFVMGQLAMGTMEATRKNLFFMIDSLPPDSIYNVCALGRHQLPMTTYAILDGGMARVGLEDNIFYAHKQLAKDNVQMVERVVRLANELQRPIASPAEARKILGIK